MRAQSVNNSRSIRDQFVINECEPKTYVTAASCVGVRAKVRVGIRVKERVNIKVRMGAGAGRILGCSGVLLLALGAPRKLPTLPTSLPDPNHIPLIPNP